MTVRVPSQLAVQVFFACAHNITGFWHSTARPCQRCIKRGMPNDCVEGHRKKAKYLLDDEELGPYSLPPKARDQVISYLRLPHTEALQREKGVKHVKGANNTPKKKQSQLEIQQPRIVSPEPVQMAQTAPIPTCSYPLPHSLNCTRSDTQFSDGPAEPYAAPVSPMFPFTTTTYTSPFDPSSSYAMSPGFSSFGSSYGSEAANLEYSILSAILGSTNSPSESDRGTSTPPPSIPTATMTGGPPSPNFTTPGWSDYSREQTGAYMFPNQSDSLLTNGTSQISPCGRIPHPGTRAPPSGRSAYTKQA